MHKRAKCFSTAYSGDMYRARIFRSESGRVSQKLCRSSEGNNISNINNALKCTHKVNKIIKNILNSFSFFIRL